MNRVRAIELLAQSKTALTARYGVTRLALFGSTAVSYTHLDVYKRQVIGVAANDGPEGNQGIVTVALCHRLQHQGNFKRTGHGGNFDIVIGYAKTLELGGAGSQQAFANILIEAAHDDTNGQAITGKVVFVFKNVVVASHIDPLSTYSNSAGELI